MIMENWSDKCVDYNIIAGNKISIFLTKIIKQLNKITSTLIKLLIFYSPKTVGIRPLIIIILFLNIIITII